MASVIVTGLQRSGTTLLRRLFERHPDIGMTREFGNFLRLGAPYPAYFRRMLVRRGGILARGPRRLARTITPGAGLRTVVENQRFVGRYLLEVRRRRPARVDLSTVEAALRAVLPPADLVGDKYPEYIFSLDRIALAEDLTVVVIYRDCRDVTSSTLRRVRGAWRSMPLFIRRMDTAEKIARRWERAVAAMKRHQGRVHVIRYETLVQDGNGTLDALARRLGVDPAGFDPDMIDGDSVGKHRQNLSAEELRAVEAIAGPSMVELGYPL